MQQHLLDDDQLYLNATQGNSVEVQHNDEDSSQEQQDGLGLQSMLVCEYSCAVQHHLLVYMSFAMYTARRKRLMSLYWSYNCLPDTSVSTVLLHRSTAAHFATLVCSNIALRAS